MNRIKYRAKEKNGFGFCWSYDINYIINHIDKYKWIDFDLYIDYGNGEIKVDNPKEYITKHRPKILEDKIADMCYKIDELEKVIATKDNEIEQLNNELLQLKTNIDEAIEYIKHSWRLKFDQVYDTSKNLSGWEAEELLSILERGKE